MSEDKHRVVVSFRKNFNSDIEDPETFVRACLNGNRSGSFARHINIEDIEENINE